jgi:hypothetical protein
VTDYQLLGVSGIGNPNGTAWIHGAGADIEILPYCTDLPMISNLQGPTAPCQGDTVTFTLTSSNVDQFEWLLPTGWTIVGNDNNDTIRVRASSVPGNVSVTGVNACGFTNSLTLPLTPTALPVLGLITGDAAPCEGEIILYSMNGSAADHFAWIVPAGWEIVSGQSSSQIVVTAGATAGVINVSGGNVCGDDDATPLAVNPDPLPIATAINASLIACTNSITAFNYGGEHTDSVFWELPLGWLVIQQTDPYTILVRTGDDGGQVIAVGKNDCGLSAPIEISVALQAPPEVDLVFESSTNTLSSIFSGSVLSINWLFNGEEIPDADEQTYIATESGIYNVVVVFADGCISISDPVNVIITSTGHADGDADILLMPNPAKEWITIVGLTSNVPYAMVDMQGRVCQQGITPGHIDVSGMTVGMYTVRMILEDRIVIKQVVISR